MELDHIEAFVAVVRRGGFTRAAGALHLSQPAVSRRLNLLEREVGRPLFDRTRGGSRLTEAGRALLPHAEALLASVHDGLEAVRALERTDAGTVTLALVGTLASTTLTGRLRTFTLRALKFSAMRLGVPVVLVHRRRGFLSGAARSVIELLRAGRAGS